MKSAFAGPECRLFASLDKLGNKRHETSRVKTESERGVSQRRRAVGERSILTQSISFNKSHIALRYQSGGWGDGKTRFGTTGEVGPRTGSHEGKRGAKGTREKPQQAPTKGKLGRHSSVKETLFSMQT